MFNTNYNNTINVDKFKNVEKGIRVFKDYDPFFDGDDETYVGYGQGSEEESGFFKRRSRAGVLNEDGKGSNAVSPIESDAFDIHQNTMINPFGNSAAEIVRQQRGQDSDEESMDEFEEVENRFKEELDQLNALTLEVDEIKNEVKAEIKQHRAAKSSGSSRLITEQTSNVTTLLKTKLDIVKEKNRTNKNIIDHQYKIRKLHVDEGKQDNSDDIVMAKLYEQIMNGGANLSEYDKVMGTGGAPSEGYGSKDQSAEMAIEMALKNRGSDVDSYISGNDKIGNDIAVAQAESANGEVVVIYDDNTGNWRFEAVDGMGRILPNYEVPSKDAIRGQMDFDFDNGVARDPLKRTYAIWYTD